MTGRLRGVQGLTSVLCRFAALPRTARADQVVLQLKSPYKDRTILSSWEPLEFIERPGELVPRPR